MKTCKNCGVEFKPNDYRQIFCSRSCSATLNNKTSPRRKPGPHSKRHIVCKFCGQASQTGASSTFEFCSRACKRKDDFSKWKAGELDFSNLTWKNDFPAWAKALLLEESGYQCQAIRSDTGIRCTESRRRSSGNSILEVEHRDGDSTNHAYDNIELLCPSCHSLTPTYRAGNRGKSTRLYRRVDRAK